MLGREDLDVNKLVYATDIDTMLVDCEGTEVWPQDGDGNEYYFKTQADNVMDAMEASIKKLEKTKNGILTRNVELIGENAQLTMKVMELESQLPKWISVKDRRPNVGDFVLVCFADRAKSHYFPTDVVRWDSCYELQEISVAHWMPLPPPPTTKEK